MKNKVLKLICVLLIIGTIIGIEYLCMQNNNSNNVEQKTSKYEYEDIQEESEQTKELQEAINTSECSEEFMNNYYAGMKELQEINNKENILIVISKSGIPNNYGACKVVEAPNNQYFLQYNTSEERDKALEALKGDKNITSVETNGTYDTLDIQNEIEEQAELETVAKSYNSWGIIATGLNEASEKVEERETKNNIVVAIIDSGCDIELFNKYYNGKIASTYNVLENSFDTEDMSDTNGHGTHVAGTIAEGTPTNVKVMPIKVTEGSKMTYLDIITAINYVTNNECANVINMSFGGSGNSQALEEAIIAANNKNIICVASAGNDDSSTVQYPAGYNTTISIASCDEKLNKSSFSNYGTTVTFTAPGSNINSIMSKNTTISQNNGNNSDDDHEIISGTSMATPHAVCAISILKSYNKNYDLNKIIKILKKYAVDIGSDGWDQYFGYGAINCEMQYCTCDCENCEYIYCENCKNTECTCDTENEIKDVEIINKIDYGSKSDIDIKNLFLIEKYTNGTKRTLNVESVKDDFEILEYNFNNEEMTGKFKYLEKEYTYDIEIDDTLNTWEYEVLQNGTFKITECCQCNVETLYIPAKIYGYTVIEIGSKIFDSTKYKTNGCKQIKNIIFPEGLLKIGTNAFTSCENLETITLPKTLEQINSNAFYGNDLLLYVYSNSYGYNYAINNNLRYKLIDEHSYIKVNMEKTKFKAFESVNVNNIYIELADSEEEYKKGNKKIINSGISIIYQNSEDSFRYGDEYFTVKTSGGEYVEKKVYVTVEKATYNYSVPENIVAKYGQKLSEIELPEHFEWMDSTQTISTVGQSTYKAKYIPEDTENYEISENIDIKISTEGISYTTHIQDIGWQNAKKNGEMSGTSGQSKRLEGIKINVGTEFEGSIKYRTHIQDIGWQGWKTDGEMAGTSGRSLRLEAIEIKLTGELAEKYNVKYRVHIQNIGWQEWKTDGEMAGTSGRSLRLEAIEIKLEEKAVKGIMCIDNPKTSEIYYVNGEKTTQISGWKMANVSNSYIKAYIDNVEIDENDIIYYERKDVLNAIKGYGTEEQNAQSGYMFDLNLNSIEEAEHSLKIELYSNETKINTIERNFTVDKSIHIKYQTHIQDIGWQEYKKDGEQSGTSGQSKRLEGIRIQLANKVADGEIEYTTHIQDIGWQNWMSEGEMSGTTGQSKRLEAIQIKLTGELAEEYDVYYRVHTQNLGWLGWAKNGEQSGSAGYSYRLEAIEIKLIKHGDVTPEQTKSAFYQR